MSYFVLTGRFNNETQETNYAYRKKKGFACMYCIPSELSPKIPYFTPVFVIEMNNSTNKIEGVGLIQNKPETKYYKVHADGNTNRYTYIGRYFIDRELICGLNPRLVDTLERVLFKGYTHSKRGTGLTSIPEKIVKTEMSLGNDIKSDIYSLFISHYKDKLHFVEHFEKQEIERNIGST
jgi:hypothetical protein